MSKQQECRVSTTAKNVRNWPWHTHTQYTHTHPGTGSLFFVCLPVLQQHAKMHPQQQLSPDIRNHQHCPSPTLLYNTLLQHSCSTFRQHFSTTLLSNTFRQHVSTTLSCTTRLHNTPPPHFSTTSSPTLLYDTLLHTSLQHSSATSLFANFMLIKHNHKNTTTNKTQPYHRKNTTTKKITQPHHKNTKRPWKNHQKTQNNYENTDIQPTDKSDQNTTTLPLFLSTPNMLRVQIPIGAATTPRHQVQHPVEIAQILSTLKLFCVHNFLEAQRWPYERWFCVPTRHKQPPKHSQSTVPATKSAASEKPPKRKHIVNGTFRHHPKTCSDCIP